MKLPDGAVIVHVEGPTPRELLGFALGAVLDTGRTLASRRLQLPTTIDVAAERAGVSAKTQLLRTLAAGALSGAVSRTCTAPVDRLKVLMQTGAADGIVSGLRAMYADGGLMSLWRGNGINVLKIAPEQAAKFACYEQAKKLFIRDKDNPKPHERFAAGASAGIVSQTLVR